MSRQELLKEHPVRLEGLVLENFADRERFYLHGAEGGLVVIDPNRRNSLPFGARVRVEGVTTVDAKTHVVATEVSVLSTNSVVPTPERPSFEDIEERLKPFNGWLEVSGLVQSVRNYRDTMMLQVRESGRVIDVMVPNQTRRVLESLRFCRVTATGVLISVGSAPRIWTHDLGRIRIEKPMEGSLFDLPETSVANWLGMTNSSVSPDQPYRLRVRVDGEDANNGGFVVSDASGEMGITRPVGYRVRVGETVDVIGFRDAAGQGVRLETSVLRWLGRVGTNPDGALIPMMSGVDEVRARDGDSLSKGLPVRMIGGVSYRDVRNGWFHFQQSATMGIRVKWGITNAMPEKGDRVLIKGETFFEDGPGIMARDFEAYPAKPLPDPRRIPSLDYFSGRSAGSLVEISGVVRSVRVLDPDVVEARVEWNGRVAAARVNLGQGTLPERLVDSMVRLVGVVGRRGGVGAVQTAPIVLVDDLDDLHVIDPSPEEPVVVSDLAEFRARRWLIVNARRARVEGTVTSVNERTLTLEDGKDGLEVRLLEAGRISVGERVELVGFPVPLDGAARLDDAVFTKLGKGELPPARRLPADRVLAKGVNNRLVRVSGILLAQSPGARGSSLVLRDQGKTFTAEVAEELPGPDARGWEDGSELEVTGVCRHRFDFNGEAEAFQVVVADASFVKVLKRPSWWTSERTILVVCGLGFLAMAAIAWAAYLRRRARQSMDQFSTTFDASPMPAWIVNLEDGRLEAVNAQYLRTFGCTRGEARKMPAEQWDVWDSERQRLRFLEHLKEDGRVHAFEARLGRRGGDVMNMVVSAEPICFGGNACGLIVAYDVTERLKLVEQLRQSQKMEAVGQLAAGVAHDFNNLLTVIRGNSELLRLNAGLDADARMLTEEVDHAASRAADLTRQLLAFSRKQVMRRRTLDLNNSVGQSIGMLGRLLGETIRVSFCPEKEALLIKADAGMLDQVILNLAVNARDAMPSGGDLVLTTRRVRIQRETMPENPDAAPGDFVLLTVADTGDGMTEAVRRHVFDPFFTTKEVGKGTGLGLATVYGVVRQHGGWVDVESEIGRGTSFRIYLPLTGPESESDSGENPTEAFGRGTETILLVEDEEPVRVMISKTLTRYGYKVIEAVDGPGAEVVWQERGKEIDLLLTDIVMPNGISGLDLADRIRVERPGLKVIFMTGYSEDLVSHGAELRVGVDFLPKPFERSELVRLVRSRLGAPVSV